MYLYQAVLGLEVDAVADHQIADVAQRCSPPGAVTGESDSDVSWHLPAGVVTDSVGECSVHCDALEDRTGVVGAESRNDEVGGTARRQLAPKPSRLGVPDRVGPPELEPRPRPCSTSDSVDRLVLLLPADDDVVEPHLPAQEEQHEHARGDEDLAPSTRPTNVTRERRSARLRATRPSTRTMLTIVRCAR